MSGGVAVFVTPKRRRQARDLESWYHYYAGFSPQFVADVLDDLDVSRGLLLDPWNGAGTTTHLARVRQLPAVGLDLNPAAVLIARARLIHASLRRDLLDQTAAIVGKAPQSSATLSGADPLGRWFDQTTTAHIRALQAAIMGQCGVSDESSQPVRVNNLPDSAAFFHIVLFAVVRAAVRPFSTSNPTWIKSSAADGRHLSIPHRELLGQFSAAVADYSDRLTSFSTESSSVSVLCADSCSLPPLAQPVVAVVTSPPYCTRLDYAVATLPELAVLRVPNDHGRLKTLRDRLIGTPTINGAEYRETSKWGSTCIEFLAAVRAHPSKDSHTYYYKTFLQYFTRIHASLRQITAASANGAKFVIVVQDSYYKEVHNDLPRIYEEMLSRLGWNLGKCVHFPVSDTLAGMNQGTRRYRRVYDAIEKVLVFDLANAKALPSSEADKRGHSRQRRTGYPEEPVGTYD